MQPYPQLAPLVGLLAVLLVGTISAPARASDDPADRQAVVVTTDADGKIRERIIWFAELEGSLYVRTAPVSGWGRNVDRNGELVLRRGQNERRYRAKRVRDPELLPRVHRAFRVKYGASDWWAGIMRMLLGGRKTYRLTPVD